MEHPENASIADVGKIAEVGRKFLDGEMQSDDRTHDIRRWLTAAANLGHIESAFLLGVFLLEQSKSVLSMDCIICLFLYMTPL